MSNTINVLFVCLGNICRSPMAEAVFKHVVHERQLDDQFGIIDSAGTAGYHVGESPDPRSVQTCLKHQVPVSHKARKVSKKDFATFDYILCMDESNLSDLQQMAPAGSKSVIGLFGEYATKKHGRIIQDPYYGGSEGFENNFKQVTSASEGLLKELQLFKTLAVPLVEE